MRILVVGAGAAGITTAEALRRRGFDGQLVLVGDEPHHPYDRPPLSKQVLAGTWDVERATLRSADEIDALGLELLLGAPATKLMGDDHRIRLADGTELGFDKLVIATGVAPRRLGFGHDLHGVHVLRTLDDAGTLGAALQQTRRLLVVGAGFLGTEVAAAARTLGLEVVVVDPLRTPLLRGLGPWMGEQVRELHADHGVCIRTATEVSELHDDGGVVTGAQLTDGTSVSADVVVVAIGSEPSIGWLAGSGVALDDGVLCDEHLLAGPNIAAVGDVARWPHLGFGTRLRLEHRMNATEQATAAAANLLADAADRTPFTPVPYFWTDQYDRKIQAYGITPAEADVEVVSGDPAERAFVATYTLEGRLVGAVGWNKPRDMRALRTQIGNWTRAGLGSSA